MAHQTIAEKIAQAHLSSPSSSPLKAGDFVSLTPKHVLTHDNTAAVMKKFLKIGASHMANSAQPVFALDHDIQNRDPKHLEKYRSIEAFAARHGVTFYPAGTGIGHQNMIEQGHVLPGTLVVASDSHANTYGALSALGTPVVRTDAAAIWATGSFWWQIPHSVRVNLYGTLPKGVSGKDFALAFAGAFPQKVLNKVVEFHGPGIASLSIDARLTIANMSTEWGALAAWFPVDSKTVHFLEARLKAGVSSYTTEDLKAWEEDPPAPDPEAHYDAIIDVDLSALTPYVSGPHKVQLAFPIARAEPKAIPIQKAYLLSCVNGRLEDLRAAAQVLKGQKVHPNVEFYFAAASKIIQEEAEREGVWQVLLDAGAIPLPPGCGPCIGLGKGLLKAGETGISATNRNFKGRMGSKEAACYLGAPEIVAASARDGWIKAPHPWSAPTQNPFKVIDIPRPAPALRSDKVEIIEGFEPKVSGRLLFLPVHHLNTDGIYAGQYTYREDMTPEMMAKVVMQNYDPHFASLAKPGDILVAGQNFGTGSSREQAVTALAAKGIQLVIAASFSQTYLRNAFNNGFICLQSPEFVQVLFEKIQTLHSQTPKIWIPNPSELTIDFEQSFILWNEQRFPFPPMGELPQSLKRLGGLEAWVRVQLGL